MSHYTIRIIGDVQGVSFRSFAKQQADALHITGTVRNMGDGSVEIIAEGSEENLKAFLAQCRRGPRYAKVDQVILQKGEEQGLQGFQITRSDTGHRPF